MSTRINPMPTTDSSAGEFLGLTTRQPQILSGLIFGTRMRSRKVVERKDEMVGA